MTTYKFTKSTKKGKKGKPRMARMGKGIAGQIQFRSATPGKAFRAAKYALLAVAEIDARNVNVCHDSGGWWRMEGFVW